MSAWDKGFSAPECSGVLVDRADEEGASADKLCRGGASPEGVSEEAGAYAASGPSEVGGELAKQEARDGFGRLTRPDGARQAIGNDRRRCETVEADDTAVVVDDDNRREAALLVRECAGLQPVIECGLAT